MSSVDVLDTLAEAVVAECRHVDDEALQDIPGNGSLLVGSGEGGKSGWLWVLHASKYYRNGGIGI